MNFLPAENIVYLSELSVREIQSRIIEVTEPEKSMRIRWGFSNRDHKPYEGSVHQNLFKIQRIIGYRNSFLPVIKGIIEENGKGAKISVKMRLNQLVMVFMAIWFGVIFFTGFLFVNEMVLGKEINFVNFIPVVMLLFGYLILMGGFNFEASKSKKYFEELFVARIQEKN